MLQVENHLGFCAPAFTGGPPLPLPAPGSGASLSATAAVTPVSAASAVDPATIPTTGSGFGLYLAGHFHIFQLAGGALPAEGTRWVLRSVAGPVTAATDPGTSNPEGYAFVQRRGNPAIAGLQLRFVSANPTTVRAATADDLRAVHTVPDPYYVTNAFERTTQAKVIRFVNLPQRAIIRIYSSSGVLVTLLEHDSDTFGGAANWNVLNRNNHVVASGVYFYHIESGSARRAGRMTIVNFAE
jgi:hypothetical protein